MHGEAVRFQSPPHLDSLSNWTNEKDWVSFEFELTKTGNFDVELLYCCKEDDAGSRVEVNVGGQTLSQIVQATPPRKFEPRVVGSVEFKQAGRQYLSIKPQSKPGKTVMDLRRVRLKPLH